MTSTSLPIKKGVDKRELQAKFLQNRVVLTEKTTAELCQALTRYTLNCARLRDSSDQVSEVLGSISDAENVSKSLSHGLRQFSLVMSQLGDIRDEEVQSIEDQVLNQLATYEDKCKYARTQVGTIAGAFSKEASRRKELERVRQRHTTRPNTQAETDYAKAQADVTRRLKIVEDTMLLFEEQRIKEVKSTLLSLIVSQMRCHAKALEVLTQAYKCVEDVKDLEDLQSFQDILRDPESMQRLETVKKTTASNTSLNTIAGLFSNSKAPATEQHVSDGTTSPEHDIQNDFSTNDFEEDDDSPAKTSSSKSQSGGLVRKLKSLAT